MAGKEHVDFEWVPGASHLSNEELDAKLDAEVARNEESEMLICGYLNEIQERRAYEAFGLGSIYDYASERFGFSERKTRYQLSLGRKLKELPRVREALRTGKIGWCKASRIASVATKENEAMWLDSALAQSVRELERRIKDGTDRLASSIFFSLNEDQRMMWEAALEIGRRLAGANISPAEVFEYCVAEMVATYAHLLEKTEEREDEDAVASAPETETEIEEEGTSSDAEEPELDPSGEEKICPSEEEALPSPAASTPYKKTWREVLERDGWACQYPGCSARRGLHVHHMRYRSRAGKKSLGETHAASNLITLCVFHHRLVHAGVIGLSGRAPFELDWTPPRMMKRLLEQDPRRPRYAGEMELTWLRRGRQAETTVDGTFTGKRVPVGATHHPGEGHRAERSTGIGMTP